MITKIINFLIVYILTILNFFVILMPITFFLIIGFIINNPEVNKYIYSVTLVCISIISGIMLFLLFINFMFNRTVNYFAKTCVKITEDDDLYLIFEEIKKKFNKHNVILYIQKSTEINAYAVGGFKKNIVILTSGLINKYKAEIEEEEKFLLAIKAILAHEMSHIINKDFLPGLLLMVNEDANSFVSKFLFLFFSIFTKVLGLIPIVGTTLNNLVVSFYNMIDTFISFFYNKILLKIYHFLELQISRNIEYRADRQSALMCGGKNTAFALSFLGNSGFFTLFSTHPRTSTRVKVVKNINSISGTIKSVAFVNLILWGSFIFLLLVTLYSLELANIPQLVKDYNNLVHSIKEIYFVIKNLCLNLIFKLKTMMNK